MFPEGFYIPFYESISIEDLGRLSQSARSVRERQDPIEEILRETCQFDNQVRGSHEHDREVGGRFARAMDGAVHLLK